MRAFSIYWKPVGWKEYEEGDLIRIAGGSNFSGRIVPGNRIYVTNVLKGKLRLLGAFTVRDVVVAKESGMPAEATWEADEYLVPEEGSSSEFRIREVPSEAVSGIRFANSNSPTVATKQNGDVDGQAMRSVRELTGSSTEMFESLLGRLPESSGQKKSERLPVEVLNKATPQHVWHAVQALLDGERHPFGDSIDFDLLADEGQRLPPKAVFGVALSGALGWQVGPKHFSGGVGTPCFRLLNDAGYQIVPKGEQALGEEPPGDASETEEWSEGARRLIQHLKRERGRGMSKAKKADFRQKHEGRLFCERCSKDPVVEYATEHAESCIEVHHHKTQVSEMSQGHKTKMEDLQCLCANCHRLVHRMLRLGLTDQGQTIQGAS